MSKPIINDLEVDLRDYWKPSECDYGSVSWNDGTFRYHIWTTFSEIKPYARRVAEKPTIYRNSLDLNDRTFRTRYLDATSKTWSPVIEEIKRRVADEGLVEKARRDAQAKKDKEEADRLEAIRAAKIEQVFGTHGQRLHSEISKALALLCVLAASPTVSETERKLSGAAYDALLAAYNGATLALEANG